MPLNESLEKLIEAMEQPTAKETWFNGLADGLEPDDQKKAEYEKYATDPIGFCRVVLGLYLTPDQETFMAAVVDPRYEIIQVQSATGVGKTFALAAIAIWAYKCLTGCKVYTASAPPEKNLKELLWGEIYQLVEDNQAMFLKDDVKASMLISRSKKEFITGVTIPSSKSHEQMVTIFSGKHAPSLLFELDEADGIPDAVFEGADGCMSGGIFVKQVVTYNPKKKEGVVYRRKIDGDAHVLSMSAFDHPNVISGDDKIVPGAVTREKTARRINDWTVSLEEDEEVDATCFEVPAFFVDYVAHTPAGKEYPPIKAGWNRIIDGQFSYKVLGLYPAAGLDQLIHDDWIDRAVARWLLMEAATDVKSALLKMRPLMGLDVAGNGPDSHVAAFRYAGWLEPPTAWKNMDPDRGAEKAARLYHEHDAKICYVDSTGVGAATPTRMYRFGRDMGWDIEAVRVMVNKKSKGWTEEGDFYSLRDESYWNVREAFRTDTAMIPPPGYSFECKRLHQALVALTYEIRGSTIKVVEKKILKKKLGYSPDELDAYMLTYCPSNVWMGTI